MNCRYLVGLVCSVSAALLSASSNSATAITVDSLSNIFAAGRPTAFDGILPVEVSVPGGTQYYQIVSSSGSATPWVGVDGTLVGIDGGNAAGSLYPFATDVVSPNEISSFRLDGRYLFLTGVFTDGTLTGGPIGVNYTGLEGDSSFNPALNEVFFMGDGLTGTGSGTTQSFYVPAGATTLYLGFVDAGGFIGNAGSYNDNSGSYEVELVGIGVPEPTSLALLVGTLALCGLHRKCC